MDAVVLAGGYATRLWPITRNRPKILLPVGEETIIDGILSDLEADERVEDVYVSTNAFFADEFRTFLANSDYEKPRLSVEGTREEDAKFGVVGALAELVDREDVDGDLLVVAGDNLIGFDISDFATFFETHDAPCLAAYDVGSRERARSYGVVSLDGTEVAGFQEKPDDPDSTLCSIACYAFPASTLPLLDEYLAADKNPDEPGWFLQWLSDRGPVHAFTFDSYWFDVGEPEAYLDAVAWVLDGENRVADDATVDDATLDGNVHVMAGAEVRDATLEGTVVFPDATVRDADLERSLVDTKAVVENVRLTGSLVGAYSELH